MRVARTEFFQSISLTNEGGLASLALEGLTGPAGVGAEQPGHAHA
jgi:hypothetical protein